MESDGIKVFGGTASRALAGAICDYLNVEPGRCEALRFPEGNLFVRILESVRGRNVYVVQSIAPPVNDSFVELLFWLDAFKRASAASVTAVIPYFAYAKGDKKDEPRVSIRARVCADAIQGAGADRVVMMDLHAPQIQGFFNVPVDDLYALPVLCEALMGLELLDPVVVAPDPGFARKARRYAERLGAGFAVADKARIDHKGGMESAGILGDVAGRPAVIVDDFTVAGTTLAMVAEALLERGATEVYAAVSHCLFTQECVDTIERSPIRRAFVTDTVESRPPSLGSKVTAVSVAPLFAEAIRRIHTRQSVSVLFQT